MKQSAQIKSIIDAIRIALLDEHGAAALEKFDADVKNLTKPILEVYSLSQDKTLSEDEQGFAAALSGVATLELSRIMSESQGD